MQADLESKNINARSDITRIIPLQRGLVLNDDLPTDRRAMTLSEMLRRAARYLAQDNLVLANGYCREALVLDARNAVALNLAGEVASRLGLREHAIANFRAALACAPAYCLAKDNLHKSTNTPARTPWPRTVDGRRYLLIKAWGCGFWSDVSHVLGALLLAEITERIPIIHWGHNSLFANASGEDAFRSFFEPVSEITRDEMAAVPAANFFPAKWSPVTLALEDRDKWQGAGSRLGAIQFLGRPETIAISDFYMGVLDLLPWLPDTHPLHGKTVDEAYRDLAARYLRPRPEIMAEVDEFARMRFFEGPVIAVHVRGSDKVAELPDLAEVNQLYFPVLDALDPEWRIFLLTDDTRWIDAFRAKYGDRVISTECRRSGNNTGVHFQPIADRTQLGAEVMRDAYLALRCARFLGNGRSTVSAIIAAFRNWPNGSCTLLVPSLLREHNLFIY